MRSVAPPINHIDVVVILGRQELSPRVKKARLNISLGLLHRPSLKAEELVDELEHMKQRHAI